MPNKLNTHKGFYTNVFPNFTVMNVDKPPCYLRKFTPDGKRFIAFSSCQTYLEIYSYNGPASIADLIHNTPDKKIKQVSFSRFFKLEWSVKLSSNGEQLNRECSLFMEGGKYIIVGSACYVPQEHLTLRQYHKNNESLTPNPRYPLENYTLYCVKTDSGTLIDKVSLNADKVYLSLNQGIYLYNNVLAVLGVQHQTIHLYRMQKGCFIPIVKIGRLLEDDDEYLLSISREHSSKESSINALKHRVLVFLYRRAMKCSLDQNHPGELRRFYQYFDQLKGLRIWKMQLLDEDNILLKYASEDVVSHRKSESNSQLSFFVIYDRKKTQILSIYDNNSEELVELFEQHCDFFRNPSDSRVASSPSNNVYAALIQKKFKRTISSAKNGSITEARRRVLAQLPISAQSCSSSPYLDLSLFSYDEKFVSVMERPKGCSDHPLQFYSRNSGRLMFKIYTGLQSHPPPPISAKRLVAFVFHPTDPFIISVQRTLLDYVVNFHVRRAGAQGDTSPGFF